MSDENRDNDEKYEKDEKVRSLFGILYSFNKVGGVSNKVRERDLEFIFSKYGQLNKVQLKQGYAFVVFINLNL
jgi:hypothetical protein